MLYIHIPYCHHKCTYCAFYSRACHGVEEAYLEALCNELAGREEELHQQGCRNDTLYVGGGTPTLLTARQLRVLGDAVARHTDTTALQESTLECNPEDLTPDYLAALQEMALFNRLSIGIQSFRDDDLRLLNRAHNARQAIEAVAEAGKAGLRNVSIDLIYGLPGQTLQDWKENLRIAGDLPLQHLSCYALTVEPGTMLDKQVAAGRIKPADEEAALAQYSYLLEWAALHNFAQYEISSFCSPGFQALHNSHYWQRMPYTGIGAAAHSFHGNTRRWNVADVKQYIQGIKDASASAARNTAAPAASQPRASTYFLEEQLSDKDAYNETIMLGLRTTEGIDKGTLPGHWLSTLEAGIQRFVERQLLTETITHIRPTPQGLLQADGIAAELFQ